ncbi:MAG: hypothetical protein JEY94_19005 [Melioribacteraceae bacterium]|nr:hypothetical protein [Melioribacteraceae bacterium]
MKKTLSLLIILITTTVYTQETNVQLNTNDNTSSFNVTKNSGTSVLKVDGSGKLTGDGSGLSNVKPLANYVGGNQNFQITANYGFYDNVREVSITVPGSGIVLATTAGTCDWESKNWDLVLMSIIGSHEGDPNSSWSTENIFYSYMTIVTDYNCPDSSDQYTSFSAHRGFTLHSGGTYKFILWANKYSSSAKVELKDVNLSVMYFPTGGTSASAMASVSPKVTMPAQERVEGSVDGISPPPKLKKISHLIERDEKIEKLENEMSELKKQMQQLILDRRKD